jgi:hypothetical protein
MSISNDLFMAILAMDSYNRGYDPGISISGTSIGNATLRLQSDVQANSAERAAGFFAQSYTWNGTTVISYR